MALTAACGIGAMATSGGEIVLRVQGAVNWGSGTVSAADPTKVGLYTNGTTVVLGGGFITDYVASTSVSVNGSSANFSDVSLYLYSVGFFADIYPDPHDGLHFQPYIGYGGLQASYQGSTGSSPTGMVLAIGGGYDWWVADEWSIGVMGRFSYAPLSLNGVGFSTISPALLATFTYH